MCFPIRAFLYARIPVFAVNIETEFLFKRNTLPPRAHSCKVMMTMENDYIKVLAKIASVDIKTENKKNRINLAVTMSFILENKETERITIDFSQSGMRLFNFVNILFHVSGVSRWSQLTGANVSILHDKKSIYRICNTNDDKLFLDLIEFFDVDC